MRIGTLGTAVIVAAVAANALTAAADAGAAITQFVHPGVFVNADMLNEIRDQVNNVRSGPVYDAFIKALSSKYTNHTVAGPPASRVIECGSYSQ